MARGKRSLQSPGLISKVYVPILLDIFNARYRQGASTVIFSLDDIRNAADRLHLETRNPADVVYRMRSRTLLPKEILDKGFFVLRSIGRGQYQFEKASSTIFEPADSEITDAIDLTPLPVRRLLPETMAQMDEQAALTIASYCKLFDHFTGLKIYRLRSHFRKSVPGIGQAELDAIDVGVAISDDETPIVFPIEAKAAPDALNRVQIHNMIQYCRHFLRDGDLPDAAEYGQCGIHNHEPTLHTPDMVDRLAALRPGERERSSFHDRLHPDRPAYTLRAGTGNYSPLRPIHYRYPRVITARESARLQGFSDDFVWPDWIPRLQQYRQVGNAVPPALAAAAARQIANRLGWALYPSRTKGDPSRRPPAIVLTDDERRHRRESRIRGASLGMRRRA